MTFHKAFREPFSLLLHMLSPLLSHIYLERGKMTAYVCQEVQIPELKLSLQIWSVDFTAYADSVFFLFRPVVGLKWSGTWKCHNFSIEVCRGDIVL